MSAEQLRDIERIISGEIDSAREELERSGHLTPRFLFLSRAADGALATQYIFAPAYASTPPGSRDFMGDQLRHLALEYNAIVYFTIMEVWMLRGDKNGGRPDTKGLLDWSTHPDRIEAVMAMLETEAGISSAHMPIIRKRGKPPTFATGAKWDSTAKLSGRVIGVLPGARAR